jgi:hypothetical protein
MTVAAALVALLVGPRTGSACPSCQAALESSSGPEVTIETADPLKEARAYHYSVYVMVAMPYVLVGTIGFLIYRAYKKAPAEQLTADPARAGGEGDLECPSPSHVVNSSPAP